jgi:hypothetical protein
VRIANENLLIVDDAPVSGAMVSSFNMRPIYLGHIAHYAIQLIFTGSPNGNFKLQVSNDPGSPFKAGDSAKYSGVTNWTDMANSSFTITAAGDVMWDVQNAGHLWVRVVWTAVSGSGTLTSAIANLKGA